MRASRFGHVNFCEAIGSPYNPLIEQWLLLAESAEHEAEAALIKQAKQRNG